MKEDRLDKLIEKYRQGNTSLEEEQILFENANDINPSLEAWSDFVLRNKVSTTSDFNQQQWASFQKKTTKKPMKTIGILSAAASIVLIMTMYIQIQKSKQNKAFETEALFNQVLNMVEDTEDTEIPQSILYENEMLIIYTTIE